MFVERVWRSVKYERVYLRAYASLREARAHIDRPVDRPVQARTAALQPGRQHTRTSLPVWPADPSQRPPKTRFPGVPRVSHRVGRSSQATPSTVDNSAPSQPARHPLISRGNLFTRTEPLLPDHHAVGDLRLKVSNLCSKVTDPRADLLALACPFGTWTARCVSRHQSSSGVPHAVSRSGIAKMAAINSNLDMTFSFRE